MEQCKLWENDDFRRIKESLLKRMYHKDVTIMIKEYFKKLTNIEDVNSIKFSVEFYNGDDISCYADEVININNIVEYIYNEDYKKDYWWNCIEFDSGIIYINFYVCKLREVVGGLLEFENKKKRQRIIGDAFLSLFTIDIDMDEYNKNESMEESIKRKFYTPR